MPISDVGPENTSPLIAASIAPGRERKTGASGIHHQLSRADTRLARTIRLIAAVIAIVVALSLPLGYWLVVYSFAAEAAANDAEAHAEQVTRRINASPELWRFEIPRLDAIVASHRGVDGLPEKHVILDERGAVLAQSAGSITPPSLTRSAQLLDSGAMVGQFVTSRSLVPALQDTALVALFGMLLAFAVYLSLSVLPLRALTRTLDVLGQERERLRAIVDSAVEGIVTFDLQGILQSLNPAAARMFDYQRAEILGRNVGELLPELDLAKAGLPGERAHLGTQESVGRRKDGTSFPIQLAISQAMLDGKPQLIALAQDITERKQTEERIQRMAHHDDLTGLPNRSLFNDRLEQAISLAKRDSRQFALLFLDLDKFKPVNDTLGHAFGDELLKRVAARLRQQVRESDTVARVGGDEFTVILPDIDKRIEAEIVARKIIAALVAPFPLGSRGQEVNIGSSVGIAVYPADGRDADALVKAADAAMYTAKQEGNSFRFCAA